MQFEAPASEGGVVAAKGRALILGVSGQDGVLLARHLFDQGYEVIGTSRRGSAPNLARLGIEGTVRIHALDPLDSIAVTELVGFIKPDEIYHLSGQSSVARSFEEPRETFDSHVASTLNVLEAVRHRLPGGRVFVPSSGEVFGETALAGADETAPFAPLTPYGVAKASVASLVANYRSVYGLFACSGFLFNHESELRPASFFAQRIAQGAAAIRKGEATSLTLGNLDPVRDFGWAEDYVACMASMLATEAPQDFVIATGIATPLRKLVAEIFEAFDLDWTRWVVEDASRRRPTDIAVSVGNPGRAALKLRWRAQTGMPVLAHRMAHAALAAR